MNKIRGFGLCALSLVLIGAGTLANQDKISTIDLMMSKYVNLEESLVYKANFEDNDLESLLYVYPELATDSIYLAKRLNK